MRILHLDPDDIDNPLTEGGPVRTREIYRRLARRHEIQVLTPTYPGLAPTVDRDGVRYVRLGRKFGGHRAWRHLGYFGELPRAVRQFDYDVLVEDLMPPCAATWTPWFARRGRPLIASVQWFWARASTRAAYGIRMYRRFVVLTKLMQATIESRHAQADCRLVPNGVDDALFDLELRAGSFMFYLGRLDVQAKGLDLLLDALARVPEYKRIPLVLAGAGQYTAAWRRVLDESRMQPWVRCVGQVDVAERNRLLQDCRFLVMPSRIAALGMTIAEANAAAKPVIIWDRAPLCEVAAPGSRRIRAYDTAAYAAAMGSLIDAPDEQILNAGVAARQWARRYDWNAAAGAQEAYYEAAIDAERNGR